MFVALYRFWIRVSNKVFSLLISGAFVRFGSHTVLMYPLTLSGADRIAIGDGVFFGADSWLYAVPDGDNKSVAISIGSGTYSSGACVIAALRSVTLEQDVMMARNVFICDHKHRYSDAGVPVMHQGLDKIEPVLIKRGAWLGQNVVVCPGVTIGEGSVIGANSVVVHDIPDFSVAAGAPARVVRTIPTSQSTLASQMK